MSYFLFFYFFQSATRDIIFKSECSLLRKTDTDTDIVNTWPTIIDKLKKKKKKTTKRLMERKWMMMLMIQKTKTIIQKIQCLSNQGSLFYEASTLTQKDLSFLFTILPTLDYRAHLECQFLLSYTKLDFCIRYMDKLCNGHSIVCPPLREIFHEPKLKNMVKLSYTNYISVDLAHY